MTIGIILAGGRSRRFGEDKAFFQINGRPMVRIVADVLGTVFDQVIVAGGEPNQYAEIGLTCFPDPVKEKGALGGIYNAFVNTSADSIFLCGCDMPLVQADVIRLILDNANDSDIVLPVVDGVRQPLHAMYRRTISPVVEELIHDRTSFLPDLFGRVKVRYLDDDVFAGLPNASLSFVGFNDQTTVSRYQQYLDRL